MKFEWDERKARYNERKHGVSFAVARKALEGGFAFHAEDQFRGGEWRMVMLAPIKESLILTIVVVLRNGVEDADADEEKRGEYEWSAGDTVIRIVSARKADAQEQARYFESRPASGE